MENRSHVDSLPTECLAQIVSLTSPADACRLAATAAALRPAADSDDVWEAFIPVDYVTVLQRCTEPPVHCQSKKDLFFHLCNSHLLLDGGKLSFSLERWSGAKRYMLPSRSLCFGWSGYPYGGLVWSQHPDSRFSEVAVLSHLCWLDVYGIFSAKELSIDTDYAAYLIYKADFLYNDATVQHQETDSKICSYECNHVVPHKHMRSRLWDRYVVTTTATATEYKPSKRPRARSDGWMELEIKELNDKGCENEMSIDFRGITGLHKCQIVVEGIEVRPKKVA